MSNKLFKETYDSQNGDHDLIACEIITECLEIPGVREAVLVAALKWEATLHHEGVECVGDIPFQFIWDYIFNQEESL